MIEEGVSATGPRVTVRMVRASRGSLSARMVRASRPCVVPSAEGRQMGSVYLPTTSLRFTSCSLSAMSTHWTDDPKAVRFDSEALPPACLSPLLASTGSSIPPEGLCSCSDTRRLSDPLYCDERSHCVLGDQDLLPKQLLLC